MDIKEAISALNQIKNVFKAADRLEEALKTYSHAEEYVKKLSTDKRKLELGIIELRKDIDRLDNEYHQKSKQHGEDLALKRKTLENASQQMDADLAKKKQEVDEAIASEQKKLDDFVKEAFRIKQTSEQEKEAAEKAADRAKRRLSTLRSQLDNVG